MVMTDLIPYLELHRNLKEDGKETILNNELEDREKEFVGKQIGVSGTVCELDLNGNELILAFSPTSPEDQALIENKLVSQYYFIFGYSPDLKTLVEHLKIENDDLVLLEGVIISLHRNSILRLLVSKVSITKKNHGLAKFRKKKGCFIATAVYESPDAIEVLKFYQIRDQLLAPSLGGRILIKLYYLFSPWLANWLSDKPKSRLLIKKYVLDMILQYFYH
jgi:hypothetical protein